MSKVQKAPTITLKPSDEIIKAANEVVIVPAGEMLIGMKKPNVLRQYQIVEVVGESAKNAVYMAMIMPLLWIVSVDGDDMPPIGSKRELESLISRLGDDGVDAIMNHIRKIENDVSDKAESIKN